MGEEYLKKKKMGALFQKKKKVKVKETRVHTWYNRYVASANSGRNG